MSQNQLDEKLAGYRKAKGMSQEKVAEYMGVSRQAVTKWEGNVSKPSSDHLIRLAELFEVSVDVLLEHNYDKDVSKPTKVTMSKASWFFIGFSILCIIAYVVISNELHIFSFGTLMCMLIICFPIQLFLHIYFSNAVSKNMFNGIAGFDDKIAYNYVEVKKMLVQMDLHIGMVSTASVFLLCAVNCADLKIDWVNGLLFMMYVIDFTVSILINNYRSIDKIYCNEEDAQRAKRSMPVTVAYLVLLVVGIGLMDFLFETRGIENNTIPALKLGGWYILGVLLATIGYYIESANIKKWNPNEVAYRIKKISVWCLLASLVVYGLMFVM